MVQMAETEPKTRSYISWPQAAFIGVAAMVGAVMLRNREGQPWIMRRRTQGEMDQLVEGAGFRKVAQRIDEWGIFTVSLAVRAENGKRSFAPSAGAMRRPGLPILGWCAPRRWSISSTCMPWTATSVRSS